MFIFIHSNNQVKIFTSLFNFITVLHHPKQIFKLQGQLFNKLVIEVLLQKSVELAKVGAKVLFIVPKPIIGNNM